MAALSLASSPRAALVVLDNSDSDLVAELFRHISPDSLYQRFFKPLVTVEEFTDTVLKSDDFERLSLGALVESRLVGVAQYARHGHATAADMAILVADAWQRQDLGVQLVAALALVAQRHGICHFAVSLQLDNLGAMKLIRRIAPSTKLVLVGGGVAEADISLADLGRGESLNRHWVL